MRQSEPLPESLREVVARAAHAGWCQARIEEGWTPGDVTDDDAKVHAWLRPFEALTALQRDLLAEVLSEEQITANLCAAVETATRDQSLSAADIEEGVMVRLLGGATQGDAGRVLDWVVQRPCSGLLSSIRVIWPDGEVAAYAPDELELVKPREVQV